MDTVDKDKYLKNEIEERKYGEKNMHPFFHIKIIKKDDKDFDIRLDEYFSEDAEENHKNQTNNSFNRNIGLLQNQKNNVYKEHSNSHEKYYPHTLILDSSYQQYFYLNSYKIREETDEYESEEDKDLVEIIGQYFCKLAEQIKKNEIILNQTHYECIDKSLRYILDKKGNIDYELIKDNELELSLNELKDILPNDQLTNKVIQVMESLHPNTCLF